jgi:cytosine/adenosine deaminase-related metal-dependent hydrolase
MRTLLSIVLIFPFLAWAGATTQAQVSSDEYAIEYVTILPMTPGGAPIEDATLVVRDGRIADIVRAGLTRLSPGLKRIDGRGKWLMPGLADMHVHSLNRGYGRQLPGGQAFPAHYMNTADVMLPFIANGVTQILEMSALPETLEQRDEIESGAALGPHIAAAAMLDGDPPVWANSARVATTPEEGRRAVRDIAAAGFPFVKVYARLELPVFEAVVDEAKSAGVRVIGHVPAGSSGQSENVLISGFSMVAHAEEFSKLDANPDLADIARYAAICRRNGIWIATTLITNVWIANQTRDPEVVASAAGIQYLHPVLVEHWKRENRYSVDVTARKFTARNRLVSFTRDLVKIFDDEGVPILPGTDAIIPGVVYGFSLHDELELLAQAGLDNLKILESATRLPAEFLNVADVRGTIEIGKAADFILLDANPLADISNTRTIAAVIRGGQYLSRAKLDGMMQDLAARYKESAAAE